MTPTIEQIHALAPDAASLKAGQGLAAPRKWASLGRNQQAVWGECQGSGAKPYRVQVDLSGDLAYRCSCPSRKIPCKHTLGLLLLLADQAGVLTEAVPPDWVSEWLEKRTQTAQKRTEQRTHAAQSDPAAQAKRAATREARISAGLVELELWLSDMVRQGLMTAQSQPYSFWDGIAARMVDAQAPGLARMLRELAGVPTSGEGWQSRLLERLGALHLLIEGFRRLPELAPEVQADVRAAVGINLREDDLASLPALRDQWLVLGQRDETEETLRVRRTWLWAQHQNRPALLLAFAAPGQTLERGYAPGTLLDASATYYPSAAPLRVALEIHHVLATRHDALPGQPTISAATNSYAVALAAHPWLPRFPLVLANVTIQHDEARWWVCDADHALPLAHGFIAGWNLLALSGGHPIGVAGEWDGDSFWPLSVCANRRLGGAL